MKFEGKTRVKTKALRFYFRHFNHMTPTQSMGQMRGQLNLFSVTKREKMAFSEGAIVAFPNVIKGAIHSTKNSGNFGPKLNGSVRSNRKSFEKTGPPFEVVLFSRSDRSECWLNGSRPKGYKLLGNSYKTKSVCSLFVGVQYCQIVW